MATVTGTIGSYLKDSYIGRACEAALNPRQTARQLAAGAQHVVAHSRESINRVAGAWSESVDYVSSWIPSFIVNTAKLEAADKAATAAGAPQVAGAAPADLGVASSIGQRAGRYVGRALGGSVGIVKGLIKSKLMMKYALPTLVALMLSPFMQYNYGALGMTGWTAVNTLVLNYFFSSWMAYGAEKVFGKKLSKFPSPLKGAWKEMWQRGKEWEKLGAGYGQKAVDGAHDIGKGLLTGQWNKEIVSGAVALGTIEITARLIGFPISPWMLIRNLPTALSKLGLVESLSASALIEGWQRAGRRFVFVRAADAPATRLERVSDAASNLAALLLVNSGMVGQGVVTEAAQIACTTTRLSFKTLVWNDGFVFFTGLSLSLRTAKVAALWALYNSHYLIPLAVPVAFVRNAYGKAQERVFAAKKAANP